VKPHHKGELAALWDLPLVNRCTISWFPTTLPFAMKNFIQLGTPKEKDLPPKKNLKLLMFAAEPLIFAPTRAAESGEMRSSYFQYTPPVLTE